MFIIVQDLNFNIITVIEPPNEDVKVCKNSLVHIFSKERCIFAYFDGFVQTSEAQLIILKLKSWTMINIFILYFSLNFGVLKPISCFRIDI